MELIINCMFCQTKKELLQIFQQNFDEMHSLNYDALIDVLTSVSEPLTIEIQNKNHFEDYPAFKETLSIVEQENPNVKVIWK